jgi:hypothetical protein
MVSKCMNESEMNKFNFPAYRKYKNSKSYFKIMGELNFEEIKIIGIKKLVSSIEAKQYPEKLFIADLLYDFSEFAEEIFENEYEAVKTKENIA